MEFDTLTLHMSVVYEKKVCCSIIYHFERLRNLGKNEKKNGARASRCMEKKRKDTTNMQKSPKKPPKIML